VSPASAGAARRPEVCRGTWSGRRVASGGDRRRPEPCV